MSLPFRAVNANIAGPTGRDILVHPSPVANVSDTARWVAVYRAWESQRPDALFRDPYAEVLAGERGRAIAALMPRQARNGWPLVARTKLTDDAITGAVAQGCDCVVNLAAGLDTRPYRLDLPGTLRWVEVDLPGIIDEKARALAAAAPRCRLERIKADLADSQARAALLAELGRGSERTLVVSEGLLIYLEESQVRGLAEDLLREPGIRWWVLDLASPELLQLMQKAMGTHLTNAPMKFGPENGVGYFEALGWSVTGIEPLLRAAVRFNRLPWFLRLFALLPLPDPRHLRRARWSAVVTLERPRRVR
jgi:methyltransferase (TIGR00027 family)